MTRADPGAALAVIERELDRLKTVSFGVDVREKYQSQTPVIASVVSYSDAMHALLFVRQAIKHGHD